MTQRRSNRFDAAVAALSLVGVLSALLAGFSGRQARAEGESLAFEATPGLVAIAEQGLGGRPLYHKLFPIGWPTTREYRKLTLEQNDGAFGDGIGAYLGSGLGVPLSMATSERLKVEERQKAEGAKAPAGADALLRDRFDRFAKLAGFPSVDASFMPIFLPFKRGEPTLKGAYELQKPWTFSWEPKSVDNTITLDAIGFSIYACTLYAQQQLLAEHVVTSGGSSQSFVGRTDLDGFVALTALNSAVSALNEVRLKLCVDLRGGAVALGPFPKSYDATGVDARKTYYAHAYAPTINKATVSYALGTTAAAQKSYLFDQAALLLGVCELAKVASTKTGPGRYFQKDAGNYAFFDPETAANATDLAAFLVDSLTTLHYNPGPKNYSSFATSEAFDSTLRIEDAGIFLVALESFLSLKGDKTDRLVNTQKKAAKAVEFVTTFVLNVQLTSKPPNTGFCDIYNLSGGAAAVKPNGVEVRSLATQGMIVRGLVAAKRVFDTSGVASGKAKPDTLAAAAAVVKWLEDKCWDKERKAYTDSPGSPAKLRAYDAFAILSGLRELGLETRDVRYLLRYKSLLQTVRARGLLLAATPRGAEPDSVVKSPADAKRPPVVAAEVSLP